MGLNRLVGIDGLVSHGHVQILVARDDLGDMRGQAAHDGVGDEDPAEVVRGVVQGQAVGGIDERGVGESAVEHGAQRDVADRTVLGPESALEQDR